MNDVRRWLEMDRRRHTLEGELQALVSEQDALRRQIVERWSLDGTTKTCEDGLTVYLKRSLYPKVTDMAALVAALQEEGLTDLLSVNTKLLGLWMDANEEMGKPLPDSIAACLGETFERYAIAARLPGGLGHKARRTLITAKGA